jgi:hypothetical protein
MASCSKSGPLLTVRSCKLCTVWRVYYVLLTLFCLLCTANCYFLLLLLTVHCLLLLLTVTMPTVTAYSERYPEYSGQTSHSTLRGAESLLRTTYFVLLTLHCLLYTAYCYCLLYTVYCYCLLYTAYCTLPTVTSYCYCLLYTANCYFLLLLLTVHCLLYTANCYFLLLLPTVTAYTERYPEYSGQTSHSLGAGCYYLPFFFFK